MLSDVIGQVELNVCSWWVELAVEEPPQLKPIVKGRVAELCGEVKVQLWHHNDDDYDDSPQPPSDFDLSGMFACMCMCMCM